MRHDGGDAETGFGVEVGGGIGWLYPRFGLSLSLEGRTLLAHEANGRRDMGFSAALSFDPSPQSRLGPRFSLRQDMGGQASGGLDALFASNPLADRMGQEAASRWTAEASWGLPTFRERFIGTPTLGYGLSVMGRDYSIGWQLEPVEEASRDLSLGLKLTRRESPMGAAGAQNALVACVSRRILRPDTSEGSCAQASGQSMGLKYPVRSSLGRRNTTLACLLALLLAGGWSAVVAGPEQQRVPDA